MKSVTLTGATGFIGSHFAEALLASGVKLTVFVRRLNALTAALSDKGARVSLGSFEDRASLREGLEGADTVIHCAGAVSALSEAAYMHANVWATENLCRAMCRSQRLILISSQAAAGPSSRVSAVDETAPARPVSSYGRSKLAAEDVVRDLAPQVGYEWTILRPCVVYGPRDRAMLPVFRQIRRGWMPLPVSADTPVSMLHVEDLQKAASAVAGPAGAGETFFVCNDAPETWASIARAIACPLDRPSVRLPHIPAWLFHAAAGGIEALAYLTGEPPRLTRGKVFEMTREAWICSNAKLRNAVGWEPGIPLHEGIQKTARWYQKAGWLK